MELDFPKILKLEVYESRNSISEVGKTVLQKEEKCCENVLMVSLPLHNFIVRVEVNTSAYPGRYVQT